MQVIISKVKLLYSKHRAQNIVAKYKNDPGLLMKNASKDEVRIVFSYLAKNSNALQRKTAGLEK